MYTTRFKEFLAIAFMLFAAVAVAFLCFSGHYIYAAILLPALLYFAYYFYRQQRSLLKQVLEFAEAVKYRDFTRRFVVKDTNTEEGLLLAAFNTINETFKNISIDKEIQQQYLSKVINMLDTAIIFYNFNTGKVIWVNDAFKLLFQVPHLGNISGLEKRHADLFDKTIHLKVGQQQVEAAHSSKGKIKLLMQSAAFDTVDGSFRIVAYQNINEAIDETETRAWQKLLRVLTHEIMNSIAPISSLAETLHNRLGGEIGAEDIDDLKLGMYTIKRRSEGLLQFAKSYRMINKVDQPDFQAIQLIQMFEDVYQLFEPTLLQKGIDMDIILKDTRMLLKADRNLIEQVLINLVLNAIEAVKHTEGAYISISGILRDDRVLVQVSDNGMGMSADIQEQIFTPFFTTRKSGTGVGLTLSKQIMLMHNGNIYVDSLEGKGSTFTLTF